MIGGGIASALLSGEGAGRAAGAYVVSGDTGILESFAASGNAEGDPAQGTGDTAFERWVDRTTRFFNWRPEPEIQQSQGGV